jgi:hypothetical protein
MEATQDSAAPAVSPHALRLAHEAADELFSIAEVMQRYTADTTDDTLLWLRSYAIRLEQLGTVILGLDEDFAPPEKMEAVLRGPVWERAQRKGQ